MSKCECTMALRRLAVISFYYASLLTLHYYFKTIFGDLKNFSGQFNGPCFSSSLREIFRIAFPQNNSEKVLFQCMVFIPANIYRFNVKDKNTTKKV